MTAFALSDDGSRLAAVRDRAVYVMTAGTTRPKLLKQQNVSPVVCGRNTLAFSPDGQLLALGTLGESNGGLRVKTAIWPAQGAPTVIADCGDGIAWLPDEQTIACQNVKGTHQRNLHHPVTDAGAVRPASDLPVLNIGKSLWVADYHHDDWKDGTKPLSLTLVELDSGKHVSVILLGRPSNAGTHDKLP